jgi:hypothetical protein
MVTRRQQRAGRGYWRLCRLSNATLKNGVSYANIGLFLRTYAHVLKNDDHEAAGWPPDGWRTGLNTFHPQSSP